MKNESRVNRSQLMMIAVVCAPFFLVGFVVVKFQLGVRKHEAYASLRDQCHSALRRGELEKALSLAKDGVQRYNNDPDAFYRRSFTTLTPRVYELAGEYDLAMAGYGFAETMSFSDEYAPTSILQARIDYKKGDKEKSFQEYCSYFETFPKQNRDPETDWDSIDAVNGLRERLHVRRVITGEKYPDVKRLSPFTDYSDFLSFMEEEFEKLGSPKKFEEAMIEVRSIDLNRDKIDEIEQADWDRRGDHRNPTMLEEREILRKERAQAKAPSA